MIMTMNFSQFIDNWPESRKNNFSYEGMRALFDYLEEYEESTGEKIEFDPVALCCEYSEYNTALKCANDHGYSEYQEEEPEEEEQHALKWLENKTQVIEFDGGIIIQQF